MAPSLRTSQANPARGPTLFLSPRAEALGASHQPVVVLGDGAPWIWHLAADLFPHRVEILDWYHADAPLPHDEPRPHAV